MAKVTAISSLGWAHYSLYEALPRMAARGFKRVEMASFDTFCFHFNYGSPTPTELKVMLQQRQALDRAGYRGDVSVEFEYRDLTLEAVEREYDRGLRHLADVGWEFPPHVRIP